MILLKLAAALLVAPTFGFSVDPPQNGRRRAQRSSSILPIDHENSDHVDNPIIDMPVSGRRQALVSSASLALGATFVLSGGKTAWAAAGDEAKIQMPDILQGLSDRATKQCLVESLGNRECLVYADDANKLYQGANSQVLLERLEGASSAFAKVPALVEAKKWSQVTGILTGPMGELIRTMLQLVELSENQVAAKKGVQAVKTDLYALQAAVSRREGNAALKYHQAATENLVAFVKSL